MVDELRTPALAADASSWRALLSHPRSGRQFRGGARRAKSPFLVFLGTPAPAYPFTPFPTHSGLFHSCEDNAKLGATIREKLQRVLQLLSPSCKCLSSFSLKVNTLSPAIDAPHEGACVLRMGSGPSGDPTPLTASCSGATRVQAAVCAC